MKISVCLASYNGAQYIEEQLKSILPQLNPTDEVILSDDHSADNTVQLVQALNDPRIKLIQNEGERGYTRNFENALNHATGDILFLSDQDDVWVDNKVQLMLSKLEQADFVVSDAVIVDENLKSVQPSHFKLMKVQSGFWVNLLKTRYIGACMAFRKDILKKALPFPKNATYCAHDYWLTLISEAFYKVELEKTPLLLYRRHGKNASTGGSHSQNSIFKKIAVRIYCLIHLIGRITK